MTIKVCRVLEQVQALHEYLDEHAEDLTDTQAVQLEVMMRQIWLLVERRKASR